MKCIKCGKEMDREDGGTVLKGVMVEICIKEGDITPETIAYNNIQLGKYSDGKGGCQVCNCYECYIDGLFNIDAGYLPGLRVW